MDMHDSIRLRHSAASDVRQEPLSCEFQRCTLRAPGWQTFRFLLAVSGEAVRPAGSRTGLLPDPRNGILVSRRRRAECPCLVWGRGRRTAMNGCRQKGGTACVVRLWGCNSR